MPLMNCARAIAGTVLILCLTGYSAARADVPTSYLIAQCSTERADFITKFPTAHTADLPEQSLQVITEMFVMLPAKDPAHDYDFDIRLFQERAANAADAFDASNERLRLCYTRTVLGYLRKSGPAASPRSTALTTPSPSKSAPSFAPSSSSSSGSGMKSGSGRYMNEPPSPADIVEGQKALDEIDRLENAARDYVKGGEEEGEDASACLKQVSDGTNGVRLINGCPYEIEALWCTEGVDCKPTFSNQKTLGTRPEDYISAASDAGDNPYIRFGACRGHLTIHHNGMPPLRYYCTKEKS